MQRLAALVMLLYLHFFYLFLFCREMVDGGGGGGWSAKYNQLTHSRRETLHIGSNEKSVWLTQIKLFHSQLSNPAALQRFLKPAVSEISLLHI